MADEAVFNNVHKKKKSKKKLYIIRESCFCYHLKFAPSLLSCQPAKASLYLLHREKKDLKRGLDDGDLAE